MKHIFNAFLVAGVAASDLYFQPIASEVKFTPEDTGVALGISHNALNYLKQQGVPYIYNKIADLKVSDQSFSDYGVKFDLTNIKVSVPKPENDLID